MKVSRLLHLLLVATLLALPTLSMLADTPKTAAPTGTFKAFPVNEDFTFTMKVSRLLLNPFTYFHGKGLLLAAGDREKSNAMTISWGAMGTLWGRPTVTVYVAEKRYTKTFMDRSPYFTVMAFAEGDSILRYMGHHSGRDGDKAAALGLHTLYTDNGTPYYAEADLVLECRLLYAAPFDSAAFKDDVPREHYAKRGKAGLHTMYIGEVVRALRKE